MVANTLLMILTIIVLFFFLIKILTFSETRTRKIEKEDNQLWKLIITLSNQAGYNYPDAKLKQLTIYFLVVCSLIGYTITTIAIVLAPLLGLFGLVVFLKLKIKSFEKTSKQINDELCYAIARRLRSGESLIDALISAQNQFSNSKLIENINRYIENGYSLSDAISKTTNNNSIIENESERMLCGTIALAHQMGGNSARIFERIGDSFHHTYELFDDTKSALAQVKLSAMVISVLPIAFLALSAMMGLGGTSFLFTQPFGLVCLVVGLILQVSGILWMKKMVNKGVAVWTS